MQLNDFKKLKRFKDIVGTLARYGFDEIVERLDVPGDLLRKIHPVEKEMGIYERIRSALEDLGPTFVKFGQIMSLRPDLLPQEFVRELSKLQDDVPVVAIDDIAATIEKSLGRSIKDIFTIFDVEPIAAASLSQVYKAVLKVEGKAVAVKVQRPNIAKNIESDLDILESLSTFLDQQVDMLKTYDLPKLVEVIRRNLMRELDFTTELHHMNIARSYASGTDIHIPEPYEEYSSKTVLVMDLVWGTRFKDIVPGANYNREKIARQGLKTAVKQILEDGFFHADPHPGNLIVREDMNLSIIDWGMVGRLSQKDRFMLIELLKAIVDRDSDALGHSFLRLCRSTGSSISPQDLERELLVILDEFYAVPIKDIEIGQLLMSMMTLLRKHQLALPKDYVIMIKALVTAEGSARLAYPELDIVSEIRDSVYSLALKRFRPDVLWRSLRNSFSNIWFAQQNIPRQIGRIIAKLEEGEIGFNMHIEKLERLVDSLENASNRLTTGIITGAIIMGSSMIITTGIGPYLFGFPALGVVGYLLSVVLGLWLVVTILRKKKY